MLMSLCRGYCLCTRQLQLDYFDLFLIAISRDLLNILIQVYNVWVAVVIVEVVSTFLSNLC